jgi:hypothetical protein
MTFIGSKTVVKVGGGVAQGGPPDHGSLIE